MMNNFSNVDLSELSKFSDLAHRWWDKDSEFKPLHDMNPLRLAWIEECSPLAGLKVLDVGCGGGILAEGMAAKALSVKGIDLATKSLKVAQLHALETGLKNVVYEEISAEALAQEQAEQFDVVTCMEMLEHVPDPSSVVKACSQLVKPGGYVYFSTINRSPKSFLFAILGAEYVLKILPKGTHEYAKFIKPSELARYQRQSGLVERDIKGMSYNPFTKRFGLNQDVSVNYWVATQKIQQG
jgi:2-polyprenyl-6-hydroxyphenyl methylase / 3-demethylubiquinone-9 3-methyltransferase